MKSSDWEIISSDYVDRVEKWAKELEVEFPLYMQAYTEALSVILKNISYNHEAYQKKQEKGSVFIGAGSEYIDLDESNIFALIGERGSGKTTALYEFCRILHNYDQKADKWNQEDGFKKNGECKKYHFHVLEPIDASVLGNKEDLMEVILASMYQVFQEKVRKDKSSWSVMNSFAENLTRSFDDVYKAYANMGNLKEQKAKGETVLAKLMNTSNSLKAKSAVEELVENFLKLLDKRESGRESYLVITVDDLDLNLENGYEMLEQLHKYLGNQRVIILVAVRYEQMKMICEKHIVDCLVPEFGGIHKNVYERFDRSARKISNDYLLKVLPLTNRIYMPERSSIYKKAIILQKGDEKESGKTIKEFILKKVAGQMNIYYDAKGVKKHFCLPDTVRELSTYNDFLDSLFSMDEIERENGAGKKARMLLYDQNHERFNKDIENRMAVQVLTDEQISLYRLIMARDIKRRAQYTVEFLKLRIDRNQNGLLGRRRRLQDGVDTQNYCYADLLEVLYKLGRDDYEDKPLVHCLMASFTSEMVREYYCYRYGDKKEQLDSGERLKGFLGKTFGGSWFGGELCEMKIQKDSDGSGDGNSSEKLVQSSNDKIEVGYISGAKLKKVLMSINTEVVYRAGGEAKELIERLADYLPRIECLISCFSNFKDISGRSARNIWKFDLKLGATEDGTMFELVVENSADSADFDIFGFIGKELVWTYGDVISLCDEYAKALSGCLLQYFKDTDHGIEEIEKTFCNTVRNIVRGKSIWNKRKIDPEQEMSAENFERKAVFPYYNLDMAYNIIKRVRRNIVKNTGLADMYIYDYFQTVYGYLAEELYDEQDYYKGTAEAGGRKEGQFYNDFIESPFINAFGVASERPEVKHEGTLKQEQLDEVFFQALQGLYTKGDLEPAVAAQVMKEE